MSWLLDLYLVALSGAAVLRFGGVVEFPLYWLGIGILILGGLAVTGLAWDILVARELREPSRGPRVRTED